MSQERRGHGEERFREDRTDSESSVARTQQVPVSSSVHDSALCTSLRHTSPSIHAGISHIHPLRWPLFSSDVGSAQWNTRPTVWRHLRLFSLERSQQPSHRGDGDPTSDLTQHAGVKTPESFSSQGRAAPYRSQTLPHIKG